MIYLDSALLAKVYLTEPGSAATREFIQERGETVTSSIWARMETVSTFHRKLREREVDYGSFRALHQQFRDDIDSGKIQFQALTEEIVEQVAETFLRLPATTFLRAGDAIHLATAAEAGFKEIYSNDKHLLAAAPLFKLKGINPLAP
jgi:predicted nucleic acid-binding protein